MMHLKAKATLQGTLNHPAMPALIAQCYQRRSLSLSLLWKSRRMEQCRRMLLVPILPLAEHSSIAIADTLMYSTWRKIRCGNLQIVSNAYRRTIGDVDRRIVETNIRIGVVIPQINVEQI